MQSFDAVIVGAGAAGLYCAALAGQRGLRVLLIDHAAKIAEKIRISGGGRCNFTNRECSAVNFLSENPHFCRSALARHGPADFIALLQRHRISFHEKHRGQLFCDGSSEQIVQMLLQRVPRRRGAALAALPRAGGVARAARASRSTPRKARCAARNWSIATGGLSIPKLGASDLGYRIARQFGHRVVEPRPALVPLTFDPAAWADFAPLAGVSLEVGIRGTDAARNTRFVEDLLFTHRGLSGPAVLQASSYWRAGEALQIDLLPGQDVGEALAHAKAGSRRSLLAAVSQHLPQRLADTWLQPHRTQRRDADAADARSRSVEAGTVAEPLAAHADWAAKAGARPRSRAAAWTPAS